MSQVQLNFDATTKLYSLTGLPTDDDLDNADLETLIGDFAAEEILGCLNHSLTVAELTEAEGHKIASIFNAENTPQSGMENVISWMNDNHPELMQGPAGAGISEDDDY